LAIKYGSTAVILVITDDEAASLKEVRKSLSLSYPLHIHLINIGVFFQAFLYWSRVATDYG